MYKLLLVSDQDDVLDAFDRINNWEYNGFRKPHIRRDLDGARQCLLEHHADGLVLGLGPEKEHELMVWLHGAYPLLPVCEAGKTPEEALKYLGELNGLLNRIRADFSSDAFPEQEMLVRSRRHFFRKLVGERKMTSQEIKRGMRLRRSRMNPASPCVLMELQYSAGDESEPDEIVQDRDHLLERSLFQSFGGDVAGYHVLPLVTNDGRIYVLAGRLWSEELRDGEKENTAESVTEVLERTVREGILHAEEYQGLQLRIKGMDVLPNFYALCADSEGE